MTNCVDLLLSIMDLHLRYINHRIINYKWGHLGIKTNSLFPKFIFHCTNVCLSSIWLVVDYLVELLLKDVFLNTWLESSFLSFKIIILYFIIWIDGKQIFMYSVIIIHIYEKTLRHLAFQSSFLSIFSSLIISVVLYRIISNYPILSFSKMSRTEHNIDMGSD